MIEINGIKLPFSTIEYQAEQYRQLIKVLSDICSRLNIAECNPKKQLKKIEEKINMYAKAEKELIKYIDCHAPEDYPELSPIQAEQELAGDIIRIAEELPVAPVSNLVTKVIEQFYTPTDWYAGRI